MGNVDTRKDTENDPQTRAIWVCHKTFRWSWEPRPCCLGAGNSKVPGHETCCWVVDV